MKHQNKVQRNRKSPRKKKKSGKAPLRLLIPIIKAVHLAKAEAAPRTRAEASAKAATRAEPRTALRSEAQFTQKSPKIIKSTKHSKIKKRRKQVTKVLQIKSFKKIKGSKQIDMRLCKIFHRSLHPKRPRCWSRAKTFHHTPVVHTFLHHHRTIEREKHPTLGTWILLSTRITNASGATLVRKGNGFLRMLHHHIGHIMIRGCKIRITRASILALQQLQAAIG